MGETITEIGTVLRAARGRAWVRLDRKEACAGCKGCVLGAGGNFMIAEAEDPLGVSADDVVRIQSAKTAGPVKAALLLYILPIFLFFAGHAAGQAAARALRLDPSKEAPGVVAGLLSMTLAYGGLYVAGRRGRRQHEGAFTVVGVVHKRASSRPAGQESEDEVLLSPQKG